jgi:hypothetical protein
MPVTGVPATTVDPVASLVTALNTATSALTAATSALTSATATSLQKSSNLSDVTSASTSRTNLGLGSAATATPAGLAADSAFTGVYVKPGDPLRRWKTKLAQTPDTAIVAFVGDSTSDPSTSAYGIYQRLQTLHAQQGEALYGMATADTYADGATTSGGKTFTSATATFTSADVGRLIAGTNIAQGTVISSIDSASQVQLSVNASGTGTGQAFYIGRHIIGGGSNGLSLSTWFANPSGAYPFNRAALVAANPDLIVYSWLINDVRLGGLGTTVATIVPAAITLLQSLIDWTQTNLPNADILLRMPNPLLTSDVSSLHYVTDGVSTNPAGQAQIYSTAIREAYLYFKGYKPGVDVIDIQSRVFGTQCMATHPLMTDQLHPSPRPSGIGLVPYSGGYVAIADEIAEYIGNRRSAFPANIHSYRYRQEFTVASGGNAFLDLTAKYPLDAAAAQAPITTSDTLYVSGLAGPISLSGGSITRPFGSTNIRITGLTGNDFTNYVGKVAVVAGAHPGPTTGDRQIVAVDLASISAGAMATATASVIGARTGALHDATAVLCTPPATFASAGLLLIGCYPSANDTVTIVVNNPTGSPVDLASASFAFWVVR